MFDVSTDEELQVFLDAECAKAAKAEEARKLLNREARPLSFEAQCFDFRVRRYAKAIGMAA